MSRTRNQTDFNNKIYTSLFIKSQKFLNFLSTNKNDSTREVFLVCSYNIENNLIIMEYMETKYTQSKHPSENPPAIRDTPRQKDAIL